MKIKGGNDRWPGSQLANWSIAVLRAPERRIREELPAVLKA
ncbi:MAG: hypothetical protein ACP5KN_20515 [Armatimonadota bacterium]